MKDRDAMLVEACLQGDPEAFGTLVEKYQAPLFNAAYRITGSQEDALDVTQAAFVKAYENLHRFNPHHRFFSWIYKIGVNESLNALHRRRREVRLDGAPSDVTRGPESVASETETSLEVHEALQGLRPADRAVVVLRHFHGLSYEEIGEILGVPAKTVKSRLFTARRRLRVLLAGKGLEG